MDHEGSAHDMNDGMRVDDGGEVGMGHASKVGTGMEVDRDGLNSGSGPGLDDEERCCICLLELRDPTIAAGCKHEFCFECIGIWANQSRRCPLCSAPMAGYLLHDLASTVPSKFYLPPLPSKISPFAAVQNLPPLPTDEACPSSPGPSVDRDRQIRRRREVYAHELFVKHTGSNGFSGFTPNPTPRAISSDPLLLSRATLFLNRELSIFSPDPKLVPYILSLLCFIDIRSDPAIQLFRRALGDRYPLAAEQLSHELMEWLRSPYRTLEEWDQVAQYSEPEEESSRSSLGRYSRSPSRSPSRHWSPRSPSPRRSGPARDPTKPDSFHPSPPGRRWDEADSWVNPEFAPVRKRRRGGRARRSEPENDFHPRESRPPREREPRGMRAWADGDEKGVETVDERIQVVQPQIAIKGANERRKSLLERLAIAKAEVEPVAELEPVPEVIKVDSVATLREKLVAEKRRKELRKALLERKKSQVSEAEV